MSEAYRLEHKVAVFPRVVLQPEIVQTGLGAVPPISRVFEKMIRQSDDGLYMVDYLWTVRLVADSEEEFSGTWLERVSRIERFLVDEEIRLESQSNSVKELKQLRWFRGYFAKAKDRSWVDEVRAPFPQ